eukprot:12988433-Ditylum_brightwellii.AAC.1
MNFSSTKETVQCLGHLTNINPLRIDRRGCHELINDLLIGAATEKAQNDAKLFKKINMTASHAKFNVQVQMTLPKNAIK